MVAGRSTNASATHWRCAQNRKYSVQQQYGALSSRRTTWHRYQPVLTRPLSVSTDALSDGNASIPGPGDDAAAVNRIALAATLLGMSSDARSDHVMAIEKYRQAKMRVTTSHDCLTFLRPRGYEFWRHQAQPHAPKVVLGFAVSHEVRVAPFVPAAASPSGLPSSRPS